MLLSILPGPPDCHANRFLLLKIHNLSPVILFAPDAPFFVYSDILGVSFFCLEWRWTLGMDGTAEQTSSPSPGAWVWHYQEPYNSEPAGNKEGPVRPLSRELSHRR